MENEEKQESIFEQTERPAGLGFGSGPLTVAPEPGEDDDNDAQEEGGDDGG